ncbi:glycosyl hydrolase [Wenyingzhuangia sp. IMCC45574]
MKINTSLCFGVLLFIACSKNSDSTFIPPTEDKEVEDKVDETDIPDNYSPYFTINDPTPSGKTWEAVTELTDEFEGPEIDSNKWFTDPGAHPYLLWYGRKPALFQEKNLKIKNKELTIEVGKLPTPITRSGWGANGTPVDYTFYGGILRSKTTTRVGNYYECRMKMNKTELGGGFWLMGFNNDCNKKHEIDITESVGVMSDEATAWMKQKGWDEIFHSNALRRNDICNTNNIKDSDYIRTPTKNHEKYYVYGFWWKSTTELLFYLDGEYQYTLTPPVPMDQEMYMQFSIESYDWNPVPENGSRAELGSLEERTTYVDYIRTFKLVE